MFILPAMCWVIATSWGDTDEIGQIWETFAPEVDYQCPMVYPSHYGPGYFGYPVPDAETAGTVNRALTDAIKRNAPLKEPAIIRPWLQSFTATWIRGYIPYGASEVRQQIDAALKLGIEEYMIWDPSNVYPAGLFIGGKGGGASGWFRKPTGCRRKDVLADREGGSGMLPGAIKKDWRSVLGDRGPAQWGSIREWLNGTGGKLEQWQVETFNGSGKEATARLELLIRVGGEEERLEGEEWSLAWENQVWRVKPSSQFLECLEW